MQSYTIHDTLFFLYRNNILFLFEIHVYIFYIIYTTI